MDSARLFIHILAAAVWVGGQLVLLGLLPTLRSLGDDAPRAAARAFNRLAWPAYFVLFATGMWNIFEVVSRGEDLPPDFHPWFEVKFTAYLISGAGAALHIMGRSKAALAVGGAASALGGLVAMYLGLIIT